MRDEVVPEEIAPYLVGHDVQNVRQLGLKGTINGKLLTAIEERGFEAFISKDKKLRLDQNLAGRPFRVLLLSTNHLPTIRPHLGTIVEALGSAKPGELTLVDCGTFVPRRFRKPTP